MTITHDTHRKHIKVTEVMEDGGVFFYITDDRPGSEHNFEDCGNQYPHKAQIDQF